MNPLIISSEIVCYKSFGGSIHNYNAIADYKQFTQKIVDCLVGVKINDEIIEGNPWRWENE